MFCPEFNEEEATKERREKEPLASSLTGMAHSEHFGTNTTTKVRSTRPEKDLATVLKKARSGENDKFVRIQDLNPSTREQLYPELGTNIGCSCWSGGFRGRFMKRVTSQDSSGNSSDVHAVCRVQVPFSCVYYERVWLAVGESELNASGDVAGRSQREEHFDSKILDNNQVHGVGSGLQLRSS